MKTKVFIVAFIAGIMSFGVHATPIMDDVASADLNPVLADVDCTGLQCLDDAVSQPSDVEAVFRAPASDFAAPADNGRIYYAPSSSPDWRAPASDIQSVPEPGTLVLLGSALLLLSWRQFAHRR